MLLTRYRHRLPVDYDMGLIRACIAARGPLWNAAPGLVFKAFTLEERARGASGNAYSSLYLWEDPGAAADFFAGDGFAAVVAAFGRPRTETWLTFDIRLGPADQARSLCIHERSLPPETDLAAERRAEAERDADIAAAPDVLAVLSGLDPLAWRLTRFVLRAGEPGPAEILSLAAPGLPALRKTGNSHA